MVRQHLSCADHNAWARCKTLRFRGNAFPAARSDHVDLPAGVIHISATTRPSPCSPPAACHQQIPGQMTLGLFFVKGKGHRHKRRSALAGQRRQRIDARAPAHHCISRRVAPSTRSSLFRFHTAASWVSRPARSDLSPSAACSAIRVRNVADCKIRSASSTSSSVARNAATNCVGGSR